MKTRDKAKIKKLFEFCKKLCSNPQTKTVEVLPGIKSKISYWINIEMNFNSPIIDYEINNESVTFSKDIRKILDVLGVYEDSYNLNYDYAIDTHQWEEEFKKLAKDANLENDDYEWFSTDMLDAYEYLWSDWWVGFTENDDTEPEKTVYLNESYSATLNKKSKSIKVGCQTIPIEKVREIIEKYDEA